MMSSGILGAVPAGCAYMLGNNGMMYPKFQSAYCEMKLQFMKRVGKLYRNQQKNIIGKGKSLSIIDN